MQLQTETYRQVEQKAQYRLNLELPRTRHFWVVRPN